MTAVSGVQPVTGLLNRCALLFALVVVSIQPAAGIGVYRSPRIEGTIIDATTKAPIEGVIVTASWIMIGITGHGESTLKVSETETNALGEYVLPAWGPRFYADQLRRYQPVIRFYKPGYIPLIIRNNSAYHPGLENDTEHMIKEPETLPNGRVLYRLYEPEEHQVKFGKKRHTFRLEPFEGADAEYVELLTGSTHYVGSLSHIYIGDDCEWKELPKTFVTLHKLTDTFEENHIPAIEIPYVGDVGGQDHCGDAEEYFKGYLE